MPLTTPNAAASTAASSRLSNALPARWLQNTLTQCYCAAAKNVTVTLDDKTALWARKQAAEREMSLSRFIGELLQRNMAQAREYERAMQRFFEAEAVPLKGPEDRYPSREELYGRGRLR